MFDTPGSEPAARRWWPAEVAGLTSGVQAIDASRNHACALTAAGGVKCWGSNYFGQLGDGTKTSRTTPVDVLGFTSGVQAVAAGNEHTCLLTDAGGVKCWGGNGTDQLGTDRYGDSLVPVNVVGLASGVQAIVAGSYHTCALMDAGGVKCWGSNGSGELGNGEVKNAPGRPVDVIGLSSGVRAIAAGDMYTCALTDTGAARCWGNNQYDQMGNGSEDDYQPIPVDVSGLGSGVQAIAAGGFHACAVIVDGGARCWGNNGSGQLGDGSLLDRPTPVAVTGLDGSVQRIAAGVLHTCAWLAGDKVVCWGNNEYGQTGSDPGWRPFAISRDQATVFLPLAIR